MNTKKLVLCGLLTGIVVVFTLIVIPLPISNGYVNLGDAAVFLAANMVGGVWGMLCAGVGSALADFILGYTVYAPATFLIKAAAAGVSMLLYKRLKGGYRILALALGGLVVPAGYFLFEGAFVLKDFTLAAVNVPFNLLQAALGAVLGFALLKIAERVFPDSRP
ncbi:MAG: ECF transporter S component [Clostridiaceae bacterium]|nr:ECF transporter S component [Eubacteriales bacterium]